jgi:hypothetical protein
MPRVRRVFTAVMLAVAVSAAAVFAAAPPAAQPGWLPSHDVPGTNAVDVVAAARPDGGATLLWNRSGRGRDGLWTTDVTAEGRPGPLVQLPAGRNAIFPQIASARSGALVACWVDNRARLGDRPVVAVRDPGASAWRIYPLSRRGKRVDGIRCGVDERGDAVIVTTMARRATVLTLAGGVLDTAADLAIARDSALSLAVAPDGAAIVALAGIGGALRLVERTAGGAFGGATTLDAGHAVLPAVVADGTGTFTLAWLATDEWLRRPFTLRVASGTARAMRVVQELPGDYSSFGLDAAAGRVLLTRLAPGRRRRAWPRLSTSLREPGGLFPRFRGHEPVNGNAGGQALGPDGRVALGWQVPASEDTGRVEAAIVGADGVVVGRRFLSGRQNNVPHIVPLATQAGFLVVWTEPTACPRAPDCGARIRVAAYR